MASFNGSNAFMCFALTALFLVQGALGGITCEGLVSSTCAFSVSSSGTRCVLEKRVRRGGQIEFTCRTSNIEAEKNLMDWIETDECIAACGLDRNTVGISSDSLLEGRFTQQLCSPQCYKNCPNVVDLYFNLAAGEGVFLPKLCDEQGFSARRGMAEIRSSGIAAVAAGPMSAAAGPMSGSNEKLACAPAQSETENDVAIAPQHQKPSRRKASTPHQDSLISHHILSSQPLPNRLPL